MFELSIALKYLIPRWKQLSVSLITLISTLVIAMVVWLILVFFSVTDGLVDSWIHKLVTVTAPVRVTPTDAYYKSYYYLVDTISAESDYTPRKIGQKAESLAADPFDPEIDEEIPGNWPAPHLDEEGNLKDLVKELFAAIEEVKKTHPMTVVEYQTAVAQLKLPLRRPESLLSDTDESAQGVLSQSSYVGSLDPTNAELSQSVLALTANDLRNLVRQGYVSAESLNTNLSILKLDSLGGWNFPASALKSDQPIAGVLIEDRAFVVSESDEGLGTPGTVRVTPQGILFQDRSGEAEFIAEATPIYPNNSIHLNGLIKPETQHIQVSPINKELDFTTETSLDDLAIAEIKKIDLYEQAPEVAPPWPYLVKEADGSVRFALPQSAPDIHPVLLPKQFREAGALVGDRGYFSFYSPTASNMQDQRVSIEVAGFYDPGIIPLGSKYIIANKELVEIIQPDLTSDDSIVGNGLNMRIPHLEDAVQVKAQLQQLLEDKGIARYWKVQTFRDYEFTRDLLQQLGSEKNLFTLLAVIIILVACSNIISMLIILVNDKKLEIGILRSMGATTTNIALIFGFCGVVMGLTGSLIGLLVAFVTLQNLQWVVGFISSMQGHELFNPLFYGEVLPNAMSGRALLFVLSTTIALSLISGLITAIKACCIRPSAILKSE